jgi:MOSC domain-containing protein YiiM
MDETGRLEAVWVKRFKRGPMDPKSSARLVAGRGIEDNANQGGKRQVTVISAEAWQRVAEELKLPVDHSWRRANLLVSGIDLRASRGKVLSIGSVRLLIHGETRPCERMDEACAGLREALSPEWRGGVYGEVLDDGDVSVGDEVAWGVKE